MFRADWDRVVANSERVFERVGTGRLFLNLWAACIQHDPKIRDQLKVEVKTTEVVIEHGQERVVIPRQVYDGTRIAEHNPQFVRAMNETIASIAKDDRIAGVGFTSQIKGAAPDIIIPHNALTAMEIPVLEPPTDADSRTIEEQCDLQIIEAILQRSTRKWEFSWRGIKISAPVLSKTFYDEFFAHSITIAPGDELKVRLAIHQLRDRKVGIYTNVGYEVREVYRHVPRVRQVSLDGE